MATVALLAAVVSLVVRHNRKTRPFASTNSVA
jgi:hypothetical protein